MGISVCVHMREPFCIITTVYDWTCVRGLLPTAKRIFHIDQNTQYQNISTIFLLTTDNTTPSLTLPDATQVFHPTTQQTATFAVSNIPLPAPHCGCSIVLPNIHRDRPSLLHHLLYYLAYLILLTILATLMVDSVMNVSTCTVAKDKDGSMPKVHV